MRTATAILSLTFPVVHSRHSNYALNLMWLKNSFHSGTLASKLGMIAARREVVSSTPKSE